MKIDVEEVVKAGLTLEKALILMHIEHVRRGKKFPYSSIDQNLYIEMTEEGILKVTTDGYSISTEGYQKFRQITGQKLLVFKEDETKYDFDTFWKLFPSSDAHGDWMRTRGLKSDKEGCRKLYKIAIKNGEVIHDDIVKALNWEITNNKLNSRTTNRMSFMKNSKTWLLRKEYQIILESYDEGDIDNPKNDNWTSTVV